MNQQGKESGTYNEKNIVNDYFNGLNSVSLQC